MSEHTPGLWEYADGSVTDEKGRLVVDLSACEVADDEMDGNGFLIAAAPDVLSALKAVCELTKRGWQEHINWESIEAKIAEAEGGADGQA